MLRHMACVFVTLLLEAACARAPESAGAAGARPETVRAAQREGALTIYANTGDPQADPLLEAFPTRIPGDKNQVFALEFGGTLCAVRR